jgi:hypothetical protein
VISDICSKIYEKSSDIVAEFDSLTKGGNGELSYVEFVEAMKKYDLGLSNEQLFSLMQSLDKDESIYIQHYTKCLRK